MNILFYQHQFPAFGGIETVTATLANAFAADGNKVMIASFLHKEGSGLLESLSSNVEWRQLSDERPCSEENRDEILSILNGFSPDVVVFQDSYAPIETLLIEVFEQWKVGKSVRFIVCEHSSPYYWWKGVPKFYWTMRGVAKRLLYPVWWCRRFFRERRRRQRLLAACDKYIVLSKAYIPQVQSIAGCRYGEKIVALSNPVVQACSQCMDKKNTVLFVGSLITVKGVERLLSIWSKVATRHPEWRFSIVGDGPERMRLEKMVSCNCIRNVRFNGFQCDTSQFYREAAIFVMASDFEGWPMVLGEAMANGCVPVVYGSFAAADDIVDNGSNGYVIPPFKEESFVTALDELMRDGVFREKMSASARTKASKYSLEEIVKNWKSVLGF